MKKITALIFAILLCILPLTSCADKDETPDGMHLASVDGEPFKFYVPTEMSLNTGSGISSAFSYVNGKRVIVSARYYTPSSEISLDEYINYCERSYADTVKGFDVIDKVSAVLAGADARKLTYKAIIDSVDYTCTQTSAFYKGDIISLNMYLPATASDAYKELTDRIIEEFVFCDKPEPKNDEITDKKTPEGMKIASADEIEYRLYVPTSWICHSESGKSEAYYPESEKSNVTVTSYSPDNTMTAEEYITLCKEEYAKTLKGYTYVSEEATVVAEKNAISLVFNTNYDGIEFKTRQVSFVYGENVYSITYTALAENYDLHIEDVNKMLDVFRFR